MKNEELEKEAEEYSNKKAEKLNMPRDSEVILYMQIAYLTGAESREKRIAELEKENAELKKKCYKKAVKDYCKLEKENAELKAKNKWYSEQVCNKECSEVWGNLDKAKEIIKDLLLVADNNISQMGFQLCVAEAEQFLSEVEK